MVDVIIDVLKHINNCGGFTSIRHTANATGYSHYTIGRIFKSCCKKDCEIDGAVRFFVKDEAKKKYGIDERVNNEFK